MKALVFFTSTNRKGRKDATGAFIPEAKAFAKIHGVPKRDLIAVPQDIPLWDRRWIVRKALQKRAGVATAYDAVIYLGHGTPTSLPGLGLRQNNLAWFADGVAGLIGWKGVLVLYACSAGKGFGVADRIDVELADRGFKEVRTVAHLTPGHASWNPYAEYSGEGPTSRGVPIIAKGSKVWQRWISALRNNQWFRLSFPFMTQSEIVRQLGGNEAEAPEPGVKWRCPECGHEVPS